MQNFSQTDRQKNNLLRKNLQPAFTLRQGLGTISQNKQFKPQSRAYKFIINALHNIMNEVFHRHDIL